MRFFVGARIECKTDCYMAAKSAIKKDPKRYCGACGGADHYLLRLLQGRMHHLKMHPNKITLV